MFNYFSHELKENEQIIQIVRKHWITLAAPLLKAVVAAALPFFFITFLLASPLGGAILAGWLALCLLYAAYESITWYLDSFIITNLRIIDIDQRGLFRRSVSETEIDKIQDVTYSINGIIATIFGYGSCLVETAGSQNLISLDHIHRPHELQELLVQIQREYKEEHSENQQELTARQLLDLLEQQKAHSTDSQKKQL